MSIQLKAFLIDFLVLVIFLIPFTIWFILSGEKIPSHINWNKLTPETIKTTLLLIVISIHFIVISIYILLKDLLRFSLGKKLLNLTIVDKKTGGEAHWLKRILRNLTLFFVPTLLLEIVFKLTTPKARFGDMIFDTEIREKIKTY